jgi:hypothetical protein
MAVLEVIQQCRLPTDRDTVAARKLHLNSVGGRLDGPRRYTGVVSRTARHIAGYVLLLTMSIISAEVLCAALCLSASELQSSPASASTCHGQELETGDVPALQGAPGCRQHHASPVLAQAQPVKIVRVVGVPDSDHPSTSAQISQPLTSAFALNAPGMMGSPPRPRTLLSLRI